MTKTYYDYINEISSDEIYNCMIQYGLFSEKLPPIFDCNDFLKYCKQSGNVTFSDKWYQYAVYDNIRNINVIRTIGIPTPMAYERLCACIKDNWNQIKNHFKTTTRFNKYIVSRIHIRKMHDTNSLFKMNYNNWKVDGSPILDISFGKKYVVNADISKCFPSIYTHAIPWAIATKEVAKNSVRNKEWYNELDEKLRNTTNGETHGILIGPHTSNLISEIVLCKIDEKLSVEWDYIRHIDDYLCFVDSMDQADKFIVQLNSILREYGLLLNYKKTKITKYPIPANELWTHQIQSKLLLFEKFHPYVDYKEIQSIVDYGIELMLKNNDNASILFYIIKSLKKYNLTKNAKKYVSKMVTSLALCYPYLVPLLNEYIYMPYKISQKDIKIYANKIFDNYLIKDYFEALSYALYIAVSYDVSIDNFDINILIEKKDCILLLCSLIYCRHFKLNKSLTKLKKYARTLKDGGLFTEYWPFTYECMSIGGVDDIWKELKKAGISFLKQEYR